MRDIERRRRVLRGLGVACAAAALPAARPRAQARTLLDLATAYPASNFHVRNLQRCCEEVADSTGGQLALRVHAGGTLVDAAQIRGAVQAGQVALGEVFGPSLAPLHGAFALDAVPFLASNYGAAGRLWHTMRAACAAALEKQGLVLLLSVPWPPQGLFSAVPLTYAADLDGRRMRENSPPVRRLAELAGMRPVRVETPELAAAAAAHQIDLVFTSAAQGLDTGLHKTLPYYYDASAWLPRNVVLMHRATFEQLPQSQREALLAAARQAEERGWAASAAYARSTTEALYAQRGVKHAPLTPNVRARLERVGNKIGGEVLRDSEPELLALAGIFLR